ncbi:ExeM/NucH family extracellular endonuclease [Telluria beijingensis]|uniref:ExeM/NucH family extracellular endonuclease n=1 Tax=Telluria beijingensis TaxID=3068633 RepID=UPI002795E3D3|nr:ExeM/NucH family extracellular endonuclease [Massilia sp. REN29]
MTTFATFTPRRTLLASLIAGLAASAPALAADVVINQLYAFSHSTASNFGHDFVELYNRSDAPVSLAGLQLQYQSAGGSSWSSVTPLPSVTLAPGQYFLMRGARDQGKNPIEVFDVQAPSFNMAGATGKVAISDGSRILDLVGYGSANLSEGSPAPSSTLLLSLQRAAAGCQDTDDNSADFVLAPPVGPRSTVSPLQPCGDVGPAPKPIVLTCPATVQVEQGRGGSALLSAIDGDAIVNRATIVAGGVAGITLGQFTPAGAAGGKAEARLDIADTLAGGRYPVQVEFGNDADETERCTVNVAVAGILTIPQIQGAGDTSPYANTVQTARGVITAKVDGGFFIQDPQGDGDPTTSDGIYVYGTETAHPVGTLVSVTGLVVEFRPNGAERTYTEFKDVTNITSLGAGPTIAPTNINVPGTDLASVEGMLVRITNTLTINGNGDLANRGELTLSSGRREQPTSRYPQGSPEAEALYREHMANRIVLDDGLFRAPAAMPYLAEDGTVRAGDTIDNLTGVIDFGSTGASSGASTGFKLQPTETPVIERANARQPAPVLPEGIKVAAANVLNFFTTFTDGRDAWGRSGQGCELDGRVSAGNCRGADNSAEFVRQRDKIVASLAALDADVVGLMEIQNNGDIAAKYLVDEINRVTAPGTYAVVPAPVALGTDAIRVAMIYKPSKLTLVGGALSDGHEINNRPPMAQTFMAANGGKFSVIANHLKSKGCGGASGGDADQGYGQGCYDATRVLQAQRLSNVFIPQVVAAAKDPDVLVLGDLNAYAFENPINHLTGAAGMVNLIERFVRPHAMPYSYVFNGLAGSLDHVLASSSLAPQVVGAAEWHNNADEPKDIDYNIENTGTDVYRKNAYRASDHDPLVVSLNLAGSTTDVTASSKIVINGFSINRATGKTTGTVTITNTSDQPLGGPLHLVLNGLPAGITLDGPSGMQGGAPYITLPQASIAPGASVTVATAFTNTAKRNFIYTPQLVSGAF